MIFYLKRFQIAREYQKDLLDKLEKCVVNVLIFINSTEFLKYGHRLPLLLLPIKAYKFMFCKTI